MSSGAVRSAGPGPFVSRLFFALTLVLAAVSTTAQPTPAQNQSPANISPSAPDPAAVTFSGDLGMLLVAVKPDKVADYEAAIRALQGALSTANDPEIRRIAEGWRVFKSTDADAKSNALYVHMLQPAVAGADYRPSLWLDKLLEGAPADLLAKYRDAFATAPTKLGLAEFAHMAVSPVVTPSNGSPEGPVQE